jgi:uncharacterized alkaline shock family protein YloU
MTMNEKPNKKVDTKEFDLPDTHFVCDIENKVFQGIILKCLSTIEGITLIEGNFIDSLLARSQGERVNGIHCEQDNKSQSINIKIEINILYGVPIAKKANEIQTKVTEEIVRLTGIHVDTIHVVFKSITTSDTSQNIIETLKANQTPNLSNSKYEEEYNDNF